MSRDYGQEIERVRLLVQGQRGEWSEITKECGMSIFWLSRFARGIIRRPNAEFYLSLRDFFEEKENAEQKAG